MELLPTPGGNVYPDPDTSYDQSEAWRRAALNRDALDQSILATAKETTDEAYGALPDAVASTARRVVAVETIAAGTRTENLVIDPIPVDAPTTYGGGRVNLSQAAGTPWGWGRAIATEAGATSIYPLASKTAGAASRFPAVAGDKIAARVQIRGHADFATGAQLTIRGYRWTGTEFVATTDPGLTTPLTQVPAGATLTFEVAGVAGDTDMTHFLPVFGFRRWGESFAQANDYVYFRRCSVQVGASAPEAIPVGYVDGTMDGAFWTGATHASSSVSLLPKVPVANKPTREMLVLAERARRGGTVGTGGLPGFALRFDHHLTFFQSKVLPLLVKYDHSFGEALNPENVGKGNDAVTWASINAMAVNNGGEIANHGGNHQNASGAAALDAQITGSKALLEANLPGLVISQWNPPGLNAGEYDGYSPMQTIAQHSDTYAGRLILENHAFVSGYLPGIYRALDGSNPVGLGHVTMDSQTPAYIDGVIRGAIAAGTGLQLMAHPNYLDTAGYMTTAQLEEVLANLARRRDAGELVMLTPSGLLLADKASSDRHDLLSNGAFRSGFTSWANTAGWTAASANSIPYATTTTGTPLTQAVGLARKDGLLGGTRELVYTVRATAGAIVRTSITGAGVAATKDRTLPASPNWVEVRKPLTIPLNLTGELTVAVGRVSGGKVDITNVRLQAI